MDFGSITKILKKAVLSKEREIKYLRLDAALLKPELLEECKMTVSVIPENLKKYIIDIDDSPAPVFFKRMVNPNPLINIEFPKVEASISYALRQLPSDLKSLKFITRQPNISQQLYFWMAQTCTKVLILVCVSRESNRQEMAIIIKSNIQKDSIQYTFEKVMLLFELCGVDTSTEPSIIYDSTDIKGTDVAGYAAINFSYCLEFVCLMVQNGFYSI